MAKLIFVLALIVVGFAGYTLWTDPITGGRIREMAAPYVGGFGGKAGTPTIAQNGTVNLGGIGAAGRVTGAVAGAVKN